MLSVFYAECSNSALYTECRYADWRYAEFRGASSPVLSIKIILEMFEKKLFFCKSVVYTFNPRLATILTAYTTESWKKIK